MQKNLIMKEWVLKRPAGGINNLFNQNCQDIYCKRYLPWTFSQGKKGLDYLGQNSQLKHH